MKLDASAQLATLQTPQRQERTISFPRSDSWASKLTLGQILKGKVLLSYGEGRYAVDFGGEQRVVDSSIPFSVGDQLRGRVVGLSERITIERLPDQPRSSNADAGEAPSSTLPQAKQDCDSVCATASRLNIQIGMQDAEMLAIVARKYSDPALAIRTGLFLAKLGLPLSSDLVRAVYERIVSSPLTRRAILADFAPILSSKADPSDQATKAFSDAGIMELAQCLANDGIYPRDSSALEEDTAVQSESQPASTYSDGATNSIPNAWASKSGSDDTLDSDQEREHAAVFANILNVQTGARLQHRFRTLPIVIDSRLLEFDLALFDHIPKENDGVRARRLHFALSTELGLLDVSATTIDEHVQIAFSSPRAALLEGLDEYADDLAASLQGHGWTLDQATYHRNAAGSPAQTIVDHVLAQDSLRIAL